MSPQKIIRKIADNSSQLTANFKQFCTNILIYFYAYDAMVLMTWTLLYPVALDSKYNKNDVEN